MFPHLLSDYLVKLQESNQQWWKEFEVNKAAVQSPLNKALQEVNFEDTTKLFEQAVNQPAALLELQSNWWEQQLQIWQNVVLGNSEQVVEAERGDKRFSDQSWQNEAMFSFIKQSYLLFSKTDRKSVV